MGYFFYKEVISSDSKVAFFNRAVDRIKQDPRCLELLGDPNKIVAFGEETHNKWRRARPIASVLPFLVLLTCTRPRQATEPPMTAPR